MKDLNKYNTALDLSKLSVIERKIILKKLKKLDSAIWNYEMLRGEYLTKDKITWIYGISDINNDRTEVDFETFKQIHFNTKTS